MFAALRSRRFLTSLAATSAAGVAAYQSILAKRNTLSAGGDDVKLYYFDFAGRAEPIRIACHVGGIALSDVRLKDAALQSFVTTTPMHELPVLELNGEMYTQSTAILRFFGRKSGLYPSGDDQLKVDEIIEVLHDLIYNLFPMENPVDVKAYRAKFTEKKLRPALQLLEKRIEAGHGKLCIGDELTIADLFLMVVTQMFMSGQLDHIDKDLIANEFPLVFAATQNIKKHARVASYYKQHPPKA
eukprot:m.123365 g.123365  ORF g.123365 m.123365 type:complete len:243 (+) comp19700_c0_seq2:782-1510(+)